MSRVRIATVDYDQQDWQASASHHPLAALTSPELQRLARVWLQADLQRQAADEARARLAVQTDPAQRDDTALAIEALESLWLAFLASLAESRYGPARNRIALRGALREDLAAIWTTLRDARSAVLSVELDLPLGPSGAVNAETAARALRVHQGFRRLLAEEIARRTAPDAG